MPSFKSDSSFFNKIAMGAIGSRQTKAHLEAQGHEIIELERGSLDAKIWKDVKRKRVRIPDLICKKCGQRIEVRTKSKPKISMSHSPTTPERSWDYGMIAKDWIAIPICTPFTYGREPWVRGSLYNDTSSWVESEWINWKVIGAISYFTVDSIRQVQPDKSERKGAEEGSEATLTWRASFAPQTGVVSGVTESNVTLTSSDGHRTRSGRKGLPLRVAMGDSIAFNQIMACNIELLTDEDRECKGDLIVPSLQGMLNAPQLSVRYSAAKLARIRQITKLKSKLEQMAFDEDEDIYIRLEASTYLCSVHGYGVKDVFSRSLNALNKPDQLEAIIAIGDINNEESVDVLASVLNNQRADYFQRSAAAYCLGRSGSYSIAREALIKAFDSQSLQVREDALVALSDIGFPALADLLAGLAEGTSEDIQAGCAEAVHLLSAQVSPDVVAKDLAPHVVKSLFSTNRSSMTVWLGGQMPEHIMRPALGTLLDSDARLAYALTVAWSFARSWVHPIHVPIVKMTHDD